MDFDWEKFNHPFPAESQPEVQTRFDGFHVFSETYVTVGNDNHQIQAVILVPKTLGDTPCAIHVKWHGGGFATGAADFKWWHHAHHVRLALDSNAITVLPNYRLMPQHNGAEILSDVDAFWRWFHADFLTVMGQKGIPINVNQLLISGESAGGFLAVYSWLTQPEKTAVKALYLQYPMLFYYVREPGMFFDEDVSFEKANNHLNDRLAEIKKLKAEGTLQSVSSAPPPRQMTMAYCLSATKRWEELFDHDDIRAMLDKKKDIPATSPHIFIYHGDKDANVPIENTQTFVDRVAEKWPGMKDKIQFQTVKGQAHAGDYDENENAPDKVWLKHMLEGIKQAWLV
ncbi:alpha/beta-hydrolase [Melanomma pulvis-pyrius CBS 109.77]|uniref:Alpha/beta-hydrolase n=1 Tax=Melanomma pulvis-pyrius CBS 109.77 TaxID=1314802 RepID=A0A6A6WTX4_9PLEO|nr:alpha/beta-hydrolase [Melanomma pulvis-pyrius CBS 109.77]